jgi:hypothetical protein
LITSTTTKILCGLSFSSWRQRVYKQAPLQVLTFEELIADCRSSVFASGLVVDAMHAFNGDLWDACGKRNQDFHCLATDFHVLLEGYRTCKKFSKNYHKGVT